ncbi:DNA-primase RepB domain-containing protein [Cupriavidus malaysiensis]|nr:DNA-primase RepB domain-containing protein [Cupriavidus malaysiensis]
MVVATRPQPEVAPLLQQVLTPLEHLAALAPQRKGDHILWRRSLADAGKPSWFKIKATDGAAAVQAMLEVVGEDDVYCTVNSFRGWRQTRCLHRLNAFWVDIDARQPSADVGRLVTVALARLQNNRIPEPSLIVYTGRGAHLYWLIHDTPREALPRWTAAQHRLTKLVGGDRQAIDCTRVLRVVGTTNSKAPAHRRTVTAEVRHPERYQFDWLCDQVLEHSRAELREIRANRASRQRDKRRHGQRGSSIFQLWYDRYRDMLAILEANYMEGVPEGSRDLVLFHLANALSWFTQYDGLYNEIHHIASRVIKTLSPKEVASFTTSICTRAKQAQQKQFLAWGTKQVDPRYRMSNEYLWEFWGPLVSRHPELIPKLKTIVPQDVRDARRRARERCRDRRAEGRYKLRRVDYLATCADLRRKAVRMREAGHTWHEVGKALGLSADAARMRAGRIRPPTTAPNKCARAVYAKPDPAPPTTPENSSFSLAGKRTSAPPLYSGQGPGRSPSPEGVLFGNIPIANSGVGMGRGEGKGAHAQFRPLAAADLSTDSIRAVDVPAAQLCIDVDAEAKRGQQRPRRRMAISPDVVAAQRKIPLREALARLGTYVKQDPDFAPRKNAATACVHVGLGSTVWQLILTGDSWFDVHARRGGSGAIALAMHILKVDFLQAVKTLVDGTA